MVIVGFFNSSGVMGTPGQGLIQVLCSSTAYESSERHTHKNNKSNLKTSPVIIVMFYSHFDAHFCWDLGPQSGVLNRCNRFLWISVYVHVQH